MPKLVQVPSACFSPRLEVSDVIPPSGLKGKLVGVLVIHALSSCGHGDRDRRRDVVRARRILDRSELYE